MGRSRAGSDHVLMASVWLRTGSAAAGGGDTSEDGHIGDHDHQQVLLWTLIPGDQLRPDRGDAGTGWARGYRRLVTSAHDGPEGVQGTRASVRPAGSRARLHLPAGPQAGCALVRPS